MAPNTNNDCSQDILFFRQLITDALSRKLFYFDEGYIPLYRLLIDVPEAQGSKKSRLRKSYSPKEAAAQVPEYRDIIRTFLRYADTDREYVNEFFVWRTCLQFAVIKKEITTLDCDFQEIQPYRYSPPIWKKVASFLAHSYWCDKVLTRSFLSNISDRMSSLSVLNAVCDNPFLNKWYVFQQGQAAEFIERVLCNLEEDDKTLFAKEIAPYQVALGLGTLNILLNLNNYYRTAQEITPASISPKDFAKFKEKVDFLPFGKRTFAAYPEGKDEYRTALNRILATAVEQGHISTSEYDAVTGVAAAQSPFARENEHPESTTNVSVIPPQAEPGGDAATGNESTETEEVITPRIQPTVVQSASNPRSVPKSYRVTRPPLFVGLEGERAFRLLYSKMKDVYFECDSQDNFTGLFRCPSDETVESYTMINWIHRSGQNGLKWFLEALYRSKRDEKGSAFRMRNEFSKLFLVKGKSVNLQDNPIYIWNRNVNSVDANHKHEREIQKFLALMGQALIEAEKNK